MIPDRLQKGDTIRIIAPSGSLVRLDKTNFNIAQKRFEDLGMKVTVSKNALNVNCYGTSSVEERVQDIHEAFKDKNVKMIICAIGGYSVIQIIDKIDYDLIRKNPKIIVGYSDNTALLNAIYAKTGLVTYLGPNFADFGVKLGFEYTFNYFKKIVMSHAKIIVSDSKEFSDDQWYINQDNRVFLPNQGRKIVNKGIAHGKIVGGNLCTLQLLQGTQYMPDLKDKILFLEDDDLVGDSFIFEFDRNLHSLMLQPNFKKVKALVIGRMQIGAKLSVDDLVSLLNSKKELSKIPIIINLDFGHTRPLLTIPIGGDCYIDNDLIQLM